MNSSRHRIRRPSTNSAIKSLARPAAIALIYVLCLQGALGADAPITKGELSFDTDGTARVWDCRRHQIVKIFGMASTQYSNLARQHKEASEDGSSKC